MSLTTCEPYSTTTSQVVSCEFAVATGSSRRHCATPAYGARMLSFFGRFARVGRLPGPLREGIDAEGIIHVAERVPVRQRFSGSIPGTASATSVRRHTGVVVFTRARLYALLPTVPRLNGPAIDQRWDAEQIGPAK